MSEYLELKTDEKGAFEGYASVFNIVDRGGDMTREGCFKRSVKERGAKGVKLLWQHNPKEPIGVFDEMREDEKGLYVKGRLFLSLAKGREAYEMLQNGILDGLSIGFHTLKSSQGTGSLDGVRLLDEVDLWEISIVTFPMNEQSRIMDHKTSLVQSICDLARKMSNASNDNEDVSSPRRKAD